MFGEVIGECQHAFVEGRHILDVVMAANESKDDLITRDMDGLLCKLDIEKAYDHINWNFVVYMLNRLGFR